MYIEPLDKGLFRLKIPFEDLTTTVYIAKNEQGVAIIDSGSSPADADDYILPALESLKIPKSDVKYLLLTHHHGDHAGGAARLAERLPHARVGAMYPAEFPNVLQLKDGDIFLGYLKTVHLPGHTDTAVGFLDLRTKTLLSGDCLQLKGVGRYRKGIAEQDRYMASVKKLMGMDICRIVAAHEYDPLGSIAEGAEAVQTYLETCIHTAQDVQEH